MTAESAAEAADVIALRLTQRRPRNWSGLVDEWMQFIGEVEAGYQLTIYDYHNDLDVRGTIEDVLEAVGEECRPALQDAIDVLDARFRDATREVAEVVATYERGFWARRIPVKLVGELAEDLNRT